MFYRRCHIFEFCTVVPEIIADELLKSVEKYIVRKCTFSISERKCVRVFLGGDVVGSIVVKYGKYTITSRVKIPKLVFKSSLTEKQIRLRLRQINDNLRSLSKDRLLGFLRRFVFGRKYMRFIEDCFENIEDEETRAMFKMVTMGKFTSLSLGYIALRNRKTGEVRYKPIMEITVPAAYVRGCVHIPHGHIGNVDEKVLTLLSFLEEKTEEEQVGEIEHVVEGIVQQQEQPNE